MQLVQSRMVKPPIPSHLGWQGVSHPKFPMSGWRPMGETRTQKRRQQRRFHAMTSTAAGDKPSGKQDLVWTREGLVPAVPAAKGKEVKGSTSKTQPVQLVQILKRKMGLEETKDRHVGKLSEKALLRQKLKQLEKDLMSDEEDNNNKKDVVMKDGQDQEMVIDNKDVNERERVEEDEVKSDNSGGDFGEKLAAIHFGSLPPSKECNMIMAIPQRFQAKPNQPDNLAGDLEDLTEPAVQIAIVETQAKPLRSIEVIKSVDGEKVVLRKPEDKLIKHLRPLYVKAFLDGVSVEKVLVDNGAIVNILPSKTLKAIGKSVDDLLPTEVNISNFFGGSSEARGVVTLQLQVGSRLMGTTFFVIDSTSNYNVLLGRDWIHLNGCVPLSLHLALIFLTDGGQNKK